MIAIPYMGLPILDNTDLEENSHVCAAERQWEEFFVTGTPWRFRGATSSPVNPLAIFRLPAFLFASPSVWGEAPPSAAACLSSAVMLPPWVISGVVWAVTSMH